MFVLCAANGRKEPKVHYAAFANNGCFFCSIRNLRWHVLAVHSGFRCHNFAVSVIYLRSLNRRKSNTMEQTIEERPAKFGLAGFMLGVVSLIVILIQLSAFFEPQEKSSGSVIGEIAADIKQSAARALAGEPAPERSPPPRDYGRIITIAALCVAGIAVVLGGIGLYRNEPHRLPYMAVGIGVSAFVMQYMFWLAILICGVALLISIIGNLDSIFG